VAEGSSSYTVPLSDATAVATATSTMPPTFTNNFTNNTDLCTQDVFFPQSVSTRQDVTLFNNLSCYAVGIFHF
jgi:hypothetical protein